MKFCGKCKEWIGDAEYSDHMKQENVGLNSDANDNNNTHFARKENDDYMICILHQKKTPCPVRGCKYRPLGRIRKSYMLKCAKGIIKEWRKVDGEDLSMFVNKIEEIPTSKGIMCRISTYPFFPFDGELVPIDMNTKTVILMGMTIHLRF